MFNVERIEAEHSLEANFLKVRCMEYEKPDEIAIHVIQNDAPQFLLPMSTIEVNNRLEFRYILGNQIALEYMNFVFTRNQFLKMYQSLIRPFIEGSDWMLDYHCFCVDPGHVFMDKNDYTVSYLYLPLNGFANTDEEILNFLRGVLNKVTITDNSSFLVKLYQAFNRENITLGELNALVEQERRSENAGKEGEKEIKTTTKPMYERPIKEETLNITEPVVEEKKFTDNFTMNSNPEKKNFMDELIAEIKPKDKSLINSEVKEAEPKKKSFLGNMLFGKKEQKVSDVFENTDDNEVLNALFGDGKKKEKSSKKEEKKNRKNKKVEKQEELSGQDIIQMMKESPLENPSAEDYNYTQLETESDVTEIESGMENLTKPHLELLNMGLLGVPAYIELEFSKPQLVIGRQSSDRVQPDIAFAAHYKKVGRMHACLKRKNDRVYLVDLGSANGTTLNGKVLIPNQPYELKNQDQIGFVASDPIGYKVVI